MMVVFGEFFIKKKVNMEEKERGDRVSVRRKKKSLHGCVSWRSP